jgi:hypothetical protein
MPRFSFFTFISHVLFYLVEREAEGTMGGNERWWRRLGMRKRGMGGREQKRYKTQRKKALSG